MKSFCKSETIIWFVKLHFDDIVIKAGLVTRIDICVQVGPHLWDYPHLFPSLHSFPVKRKRNCYYHNSCKCNYPDNIGQYICKQKEFWLCEAWTIILRGHTEASRSQELNQNRDGWERKRQGSEVMEYVFKANHTQLLNIDIITNVESDSTTHSDDHSIPQLLNPGP